MLETRQGDGTYVTTLDPGRLLSPVSLLVDLSRPENIADLQSVRRVLETEAAGRAALHIRDEELAAAGQVLATMEQLLQREPIDHEAVMDADIVFHRIIAAASRNSTLAALIEALASRTVRGRLWRAINEEGAEQHTHAEHRAILTALRARDPDAAVAVAVHDVRRAELTRGDRVVVVGGGPIGVLIAAVARHEGAEVVLVEVDQGRRQAAAEMGFQVLDPADQVARVEDWTSGAGADVVFEVSGAAAAVLGATDLLKVRGTLVVVAIHPEPRPVNLHRVFWRELRVLGARVYQRTDFERAVELLVEGAIPAARLITDVKPITATAEAFATLESGRAMKVLIDLAEEGERA